MAVKNLQKSFNRFQRHSAGPKKLIIKLELSHCVHYAHCVHRRNSLLKLKSDQSRRFPACDLKKCVLLCMRKFKMAAIFSKTDIFENWAKYSEKIPCGLKILLKSLYLARFLGQKHFCILQ